ncbi:UDP-N-acetylmuramoyl-L-alanine--D-glutamate ligase, partial [Mahella sp.]|uniref:UDP-N-acetylmuramoyl-L-alanine--D-glutamate ligase n=1 Tax=Mahella sp. TaxID=2798721 RepID=UPI0025C37272
MDLRDKRILIIGMALSGIAAAKVLYRHGAHIILNDIKEQCELGDALNQLEGIKAEYAFGTEPDELLERCDMAIVSPGVPLDKPFVKKARSLGIELIGEVELAYRLSDAPIAAITGTNGKTTTTALTGHIFKLAGINTFVCGNIGTPMISAIEQYGPNDVVVAEISSFQLESIKRFKPRVSAILNITEDHLNRHGTFDNYIAIKSRIFMNQGPDDYVVLNMDNEPCRQLMALPKAHVLPFSRKRELDEGAMVKDDYIICRLNGREDKICRVGDIKIPGKHNLENALASAAIAYAMGIGPDVIAQGLRTFEGVEHRIEFVDEI